MNFSGDVLLFTLNADAHGSLVSLRAAVRGLRTFRCCHTLTAANGRDAFRVVRPPIPCCLRSIDAPQAAPDRHYHHPSTSLNYCDADVLLTPDLANRTSFSGRQTLRSSLNGFCLSCANASYNAAAFRPHLPFQHAYHLARQTREEGGRKKKKKNRMAHVSKFLWHLAEQTPSAATRRQP